jgi:hypothetical protein
MTVKQKRRKSGARIDRRLLIFFSVAPFVCLLTGLLGLFVAWYVSPTRYVNARVSDLSDEYAQEIVIMAAADFAEYEDVERARGILARLEVPNTTQYVALVAEDLIRTHRGPVDEDIKNVVELAKALGVSTISMVAYVSPPTATFTATPTWTPFPTPTNTPVVELLGVAAPLEVGEVQAAAGEVVALSDQPLEATEVEVQLPLPTDTPIPQPTVVPNTPTPLPPTETPTPEPTSVPEFDFIITEQRLLTKDENGGCGGNHNIFVDVLDASGNPLKDVQLGDIWNNPGPVTGHKGADLPGRAEYDLYKNSGYHILVKSDPSAGREVTSQVSDLLSTDDWKIGIPRLVEGGYCPDQGTCEVLWNSGTFGVGNNSLCWGHYSWKVVFQRTW